MRDRSLWFVRFAQSVSQFTGQPVTFFIALATIVVWAISGPLFGFSDTWQLVINTGTTIVKSRTPVRAEAVPKRAAGAKARKG